MNKIYLKKFLVKTKMIKAIILFLFISIGVFPQLKAAGVVVHSTCYGISTGSFDVDVNGIFTNDVKYVLTNATTSVIVEQTAFMSSKTYTFLNLPSGNYKIDIIEQFTGDSFLYNREMTTYDPVSAGTIGVDHSVCSPGNPNLLTSVIAASGGTGSWHYDWEVSDDNGVSWTSLNWDFDTYDPLSGLTETSLYKREAWNNCPADFSDSIKVTVVPSLSAGTINSPVTSPICYGSTPAINGNVDASGGSGFAYQWEYNTGSGYVDIPGATQKNLTNSPALTVNTRFRRKAIDPTCGTLTSNEVIVNVSAQLNGGKIGTSRIYCSGSNPDPLTNITAGSGGFGAASYRWQYTTNLSGTWTDGGTNYLSYDFSSNITQTTYIRRRFTNSCGTVYSDTVTLTVPRADITVIQGLTCNDGNDGQLQASLTGSTPVSYSWYGGSPARARGTNPLATDLEQGTYTVTITDNAGCSNVRTIFFVYGSQPLSVIPRLLTVGASSTKTCSKLNNGSITITATGGEAAYQYAVARTGIDSIGAQGGNVFNTLYNGNYNAWVIDNRGCRKFTSILVDSTAAPIVNAGGNQNNCANKSISLTGTASNYSSLQWTIQSGTGSLSGATTLTPSYTPGLGDAGNTVVLRLTANGSGNCTSVFDEVSIAVSAAPTANAGLDQNTCVNKSIAITGTASNYSSIQWTVVTGSGTLTNATTLTPTYTPVAADAGTTVTLRLTVNGNSNCDAVTDDVNILIRQIPTANAGLDQATCVNKSIAITGSASNYSGVQWTVVTGSGTLTNAATLTPSYTPVLADAGTTVTLRLTVNGNSNCDAVTDDVDIAVSAAPTANAGLDQNTCENKSITITGAASNYTSVQWTVVTGSGTLTDASTLTPTYTPVAADAGTTVTLRLTVNGDSNCDAANDDVNIDISAPPIVNAGLDLNTCENKSVTLTGTASNYASILWTVVSGLGTIDNPNSLTPTYNPVAADAGTIVTLRLTATGNSNCDAVTDDVNIDITSAPTADAGSDQTTCENKDIIITGTATNYSSVQWIVISGAGSLADASTLTPTYTPAASDANTTVTLQLVANGNGLCSAITDNVDISIIEAPVAYAGRDTTICYGLPVTLKGAKSNKALFQWTTNGSGSFNFDNIINPEYTPSQADLDNGSVELTLTVFGDAFCDDATDIMSVNIPKQLRASIGSVAPFTIKSTTKIKVGLSTSGHDVIQDLGYYLLAPDGVTRIELKQAPMEYDPFGFCNFGGDVNNLVFNSELPITDSLDICGMTTPLTGEYALTGDLALIYGMNPAEGGWSVMVKDVTNNKGGIDGYLTDASISFTDVSDFTGVPVTVEFKSTGINYPIEEPLVVGQQTYTSYVVPLGLRTTCSYSCDAQAKVNVIGGTAPYTFLWDDDASSTTQQVALCKGTYTVTVTDALGCITSATVEVISPAPIEVTSLVYTEDLSCKGGTTDVTLTANGGTSTIRYTYNGTDFKNSGETFTGLVAGEYTFSIFDVNNCRLDTTIEIKEPAELKVDSLKPKSLSCNGANDGEIQVYVSGGTEPYSFTLSTGENNTTGLFQNLIPGSYTVSITDKNTCSTLITDAIVISEPAVLNINTVDVTQIACNGANSGEIQIHATGGTKPYLFSIDNGLTFQSDSTFVDLIPGIRKPVVRDANNCEDNDVDIAITEPPAIVIDAVAQTNIETCFDNPEGSIIITASGGTGPLEYSILGNINANYQASGVFTGLLAGSYTVYVRDANGCVNPYDSNPVILTSPPEIRITTLTYTNVSGTTKGTIHAVAEGGTGALWYTLIPGSGVPQANGDFANLDPGKYYIKVEDSKTPPCFKIDSVYISNLLVDVDKKDVRCYGDSTGQIILTVPGGGSDIKYYLTKGTETIEQTTGTFTKLPMGMYDIKVVDGTGATFLTSVSIGSGKQFESFVILPSHIEDCAGDNTGAMIVQVEGGSGTLKYAIDSVNFQTSNLFNNLLADTYKVFVVDDSGCYVTKTMTITEPAPVVATYVKTDILGSTKGTVQLTATGGAGTYEYSLDDSNYQSSPNFTDLEAKVYTGYARDVKGCKGSVSFEIIPSPFTIDFLETHICNENDGAIAVVCDCEAGTTYSINNGDSFQSERIFTGLSEGTYPVVVKLPSGDLYTASVVLGKKEASVDIIRPSCAKYFDDGEIDLTVLNIGDDPVTYLWSSGKTTQDIDSITGGTYSVKISTNDCIIDTSFVVTGVNSVVADAGLDVSICPGTSAVLGATGGSSYSWYPNLYINNQIDQKPVVSPVLDMTYLVRVSEGECFDIDSVKVSIYPKLGISAGRDTAVGSGNMLQLEAMGGEFAHYIWNPSTYLTSNNTKGTQFFADPTISDSTIAHVVIGITEFGCIEMDTVNIKVVGQLRIYSGFTPNDDGFNDFWEIENADAYPDIKVIVFNRWGEKVYESKGYDDSKRFDGTRNGRPLPDGTYYYVVELGDGLRQSGPLTIVR